MLIAYIYAVRGFLVLRRQLNLLKQDNSSGCSTTQYTHPPSGSVDRPTTAAEERAPASPAPVTVQRSKTKRQARKRGGRSKAKAGPQEGEGEPWPTCWVLNLTMLFRLSKPMPDFGTDKMRALFKTIRRRALRLAAHNPPAWKNLNW